MAAAPSRKSPRGAFITFEGVDGCGKTTQAELLAERLRAAGRTVVLTREPGGTNIGRSIRDILLATRNQFIEEGNGSALEPNFSEEKKSRFRGMNPVSQLLLFLADRVQHLEEVIRPALLRGEIVICDRYHDATVAYQHYGRGLNLSYLKKLIDTEINSTPPCLTFLLDIDAELAWGRSRTESSPHMQLTLLDFQDDARGRKERRTPIDKNALDPEARELLSFFQKVRSGYLSLQKKMPERIVIIDGSKSIKTIERGIWKIIKTRNVL